jgi:hypothetical protein
MTLPTHTIETRADGCLILRDHGGEPVGMYSGPSAMRQGAFWADNRRGWSLYMVDVAVERYKNGKAE